MRVFSTFSGIGAATAAWKPLGWQMVAYAEPEAFPALVLSTRCGATPPIYLPRPEAIHQEWLMKSLAMLEFDGRDAIPAPLRKHTSRQRRPNHAALEQLWDQEIGRIAKLSGDEHRRRKNTVAYHRIVPIPEQGSIPNFGDIGQITDEDLAALGPVDLLEGGSPCQAFSPNGKRMGMDDYRGNLMLTFCMLARRMQQINGLKWVLWENVMGVFNDKENGFGWLLASLAGEQGRPLVRPGTRWSNAGFVSGPGGTVGWRVLDSQYFGLPQRRRRVFALAHLGEEPAGAGPGEVLFEPIRQGWRPEGSSKAGEAVARVAGEGSAGSVKRRAEAKQQPALNCRSMGAQPAYSLSMDSKGTWATEKTGTLLASAGHNPPLVVYHDDRQKRYVVRKLLPLEAERVQGFPDHWTNIDVGGRPPADKDRYQSLGNSMSVPVMRWIGDRLQQAVAAD